MHILHRAPRDTIYDDPAFSPDPHDNPFFTAAWAASTTQPALKGDTYPSQLQGAEDFTLLLPPNAYMFSDDHSSNTHETNSSSNHTSSTSFSTPPTSTDSHSSPWAPLPSDKVAQSLPWPPETQKKKKNITMFWRKAPPETVLEPVDVARNVPAEPSSSLPMVQPLRPSLARNVTAPETAQPKGPTLPPRPATTAADSKPPPASSRRAIGGRTFRAPELDRIDELDESNPLGLPVHHRGPYEAAQQAASQEAKEERIPHNIGSQYQLAPNPTPNKDRAKQPRKRNPSEVTGVPSVPSGISLNLSPGQILPHDFYFKLSQNAISQTGLSDALDWPPRSHRSQPYLVTNQQSPQPQHDPRRKAEIQIPLPAVYDSKHSHLDGIQRSSHQSAPPEYSTITTDSYAMDRDNKSLQVQFNTVNFDGYDTHSAPVQDVMRHQLYSPLEPQSHLGPPPNFNAPSPDNRGSIPSYRHNPSNNRLPPRMQALQMQNARPSEYHSRPLRPFHGGPELVDADNVIQNPRRRPQPLGQTTYTPLVEPEQLPLFVDNNGFPASAPSPPFEPPPVFPILEPVPPMSVSQQPQLRDHDVRSSHKSVASSAMSTNSGNSRHPHPPNHLPKRLVMPAPLQSFQSTAPRHQTHTPAPRHSDQSWQPQLPPVVQTALGFHSNGQLPRAQDVPMSHQSRKLRKRSSVQGLSAAAQPVASTQPLTFEPTSLYNTDIPPPQSAMSTRKPEKTPKKVLSKRRTDL
ncbi:hypothetical protein DXG03_008912 [Asterophora parasitica]|uniref:Uncharacterized protein n=1 Tax=Asterophora parasitica TaxID=117018 RepID=A0A9P7GBP5_9AGAR|nr:hypothetical protein DXG03_008912 [Asterophora parasitica]